MKILFLDIDGTVLSHTTGRIPNDAVEQIKRIRHQGILVFGCTGRHKLELAKLPLENFVVDGWITMNGSMNYLCDGSCISAYPIMISMYYMMVSKNAISLPVFRRRYHVHEYA